jgi:uncharacterized protein YdhG (YjbR/CyaY superfamily)
MAKSESNFKSVDEYITSQPEKIRGTLETVRSAIRKAVPQTDEVISYKMPTYKLRDETVLHFAAWRHHYSLYAATASVVAAFKRELAPYDVIKGTIRFPLSEPVPEKLIERIAKFRAKEVRKRVTEKTAPKPKKR